MGGGGARVGQQWAQTPAGLLAFTKPGCSPPMSPVLGLRGPSSWTLGRGLVGCCHTVTACVWDKPSSCCLSSEAEEVTEVGYSPAVCGRGSELRPSCPCVPDINECQRYAGRLCGHKCENTPGSYHCSCSVGFRLSVDGRSCEGAQGTGRRGAVESPSLQAHGGCRGSFPAPLSGLVMGDGLAK